MNDVQDFCLSQSHTILHIFRIWFVHVLNMTGQVNSYSLAYKENHVGNSIMISNSSEFVDKLRLCQETIIILIVIGCNSILVNLNGTCNTSRVIFILLIGNQINMRVSEYNMKQKCMNVKSKLQINYQWWIVSYWKKYNYCIQQLHACHAF